MTLRRIKTIVVSLAAALSLALPIVITGQAAAQIDPATQSAACQGIGGVGGNCDEQSANTSIDRIIALVVNIMSWIVGVAAVIMLIIGGFRYVTSGGDSNNTAAAKNTILYALIGLVVAVMSQILVRFVLDRATSSLIDPLLKTLV